MPRIVSIFQNGRDQLGKNLSTFYKRRITRLSPTTSATTAIAIPILMILGSPGDFWRIIKQGIFTTLFAGNLGAYRYSGNSYFIPHPNPLVHTWSLATEEQIYIFIPFFISAIFLVCRKNFALRVIGFSTIFSFLFEFLLIHTNFLKFHVNAPESVVFYSPFTRLWQFCLGCACFAYSE